MQSVALELLRRSSRIAQMNNTSTVAYKRMKSRHNLTFVTYSADSEYAFLIQAQRVGAMYATFLKNRPVEVEDVACSVLLKVETKAVGEEGEVPAVTVSFGEEADESDDADDIDDEVTKKLALPSSNKKRRVMMMMMMMMMMMATMET
jgi:hypothetical protein